MLRLTIDRRPTAPFALALTLVLITRAALVLALERQPNTTLALPQDPPVFGYTAEPAFGALRFTDPVAITTPPGETNRLFIVEQNGVIAVIPDLENPTREVFLDITSRVAGGAPNDERGLLGLAFHPGYATNGHFFAFYSTTTNGALHQRVSRFRVSDDNPNRALPGSEMILLSQRDEAGNHNGGDLHFGPDGYLYIAVGDEGGANDAYNNSQRIDLDYHAGILRIDVDQRPGSLPPNPHPAVFPGTYSVPPDNPWIGATSFNGRAVDPARVRTEFWAVGLRNPWRMSFDPATGRLWCGDVGQNAREEINVIVGGGNYGWAYREGTLNGPKASQAPPGFTQVAPVVQYARGSGPTQGNSVTGGVVYRGKRLAQLDGAYVFGDYVSGNIWAIHWNGTNTPPMQRLTSRGSVAGFGHDPRNGDILLADQGTDSIRRLGYSETFTGKPFPPTLADTGAFADLATLEPHAGIVPYALNVPFWSDGALKHRWFSVPDTNQFITFRAEEPWLFPTGAVWIKHFELELTNGVPESRRRLETRFIVRNPAGVYGLTYRWTDPPTNAVLVPEEGFDEVFTLQDGGATRTQVWHYPSRSECLRCHTPASGGVLGFKTSQLHRDVALADGTVTNQLALLAAAPYFEGYPGSHHTLPALAAPDDTASSTEWRVRSWLDANCSHCHRPGATGFGALDARASVPLSQTGLLDGLLRHDEGDPDNRLVAPGSVPHSMVHSRIARLGPGRMPPLASSVIDEAAAALLRQWITNDLPAWQSLTAWQTTHFSSPDHPLAAADADPDGDHAVNGLEYLTGTNPGDPIDVWRPALARADLAGAPGILLRFAHLANRGFVVEWTERLEDDTTWQPLEVPENRFFIAAEPFTAEIPQPAEGATRYYRVRVFEP